MLSAVDLLRPGGLSDGARETGTVQPDFDVLIPPFFPLDLRWRLARFADYVGGDHLSVYRIHADSVERARERGMTEEEMVGLLEQLPGAGCPPT